MHNEKVDTLLDKQILFTKLIALLIIFAYTHGYELTFSVAWNPDATRLHKYRLAVDLNLFIDKKWMSEDCPQWHKLGDYWKSLHPLCRWGGDFKGENVGDFNHFSLEHEGMK